LIYNLNKDAETGWTYDDPNKDLITWENARADVKKVQLEFRDNKAAQIADLKIDYCNN